jgi:hypothetical protein
MRHGMIAIVKYRVAICHSPSSKTSSRMPKNQRPNSGRHRQRRAAILSSCSVM